jgi:LacI family transcriptional regulator
MKERARHPTNDGSPRRATLSDVAREAGVSVMTVSNFVHGKAVRVQTRELVEAAIARLNYRPNVSARRLRLAREYSVGIVIADTDPEYLNDPFISRLVSGLSNYLSNLDFTLDVQGVPPERFEDATILSKLGNEALCAILSGPRTLRRQHFDYLCRLGQPIIVFREIFRPSSPDVAIVGQDDLSGGRQLGEHLRQRGVRSVMFVRPSLEWCAVERREKGLRTALEARGSRADVRTVIASSERFKDVHGTVALELARRMPEAIVTATDSMAAAALKACEHRGLRVPRDLMVAGFNGFDVWSYTSPTLTTVVSPAYEMGRLAGELLIERLKSGRLARRTVTMPVRLQIGQSTG